MGSLRYTNLLLTIIALCLVYQCLKFEAQPISAAAVASSAPVAVTFKEPVRVRLEELGSAVKFNLPRVPVEVERIGSGAEQSLSSIFRRALR